ncbi:hypothetical protein LUX05_17290 [Streptomyces somaliensis]|nr:hypothetical protein [Streptomyces somaliensis]
MRGADGWPAYRTDPGRPQLTGNDPLLVGGQGAAYYSSHTPEVWTRTLAALGGGWTSHGRNLQSLDNPVTDALFAVGARWRDGELVRNPERVPLVTVRPATGPGESGPRYGSSAFRNQELLLGARVYGLPADGVCPVGSDVFVWAPDFTGTARLGGAGRPAELRGGLPKRRAAMAPLGTQRAPGARVEWRGRGAVPEGSVGCLDRGRLDGAVARLRASAAVEVRVDGGGVRAVLPPGARGWRSWRRHGSPGGGAGAAGRGVPGAGRRGGVGRFAGELRVPPAGAAGRGRGRGGGAAGADRGGGAPPARTSPGRHQDFTRAPPCRLPGPGRIGVACPACPLS